MVAGFVTVKFILHGKDGDRQFGSARFYDSVSEALNDHAVQMVMRRKNFAVTFEWQATP